MHDESFVSTGCIICNGGNDEQLYPARLDKNSFTGYAYSARRKRKREHYRIVKCKTCSQVRSDPILNEERINQLYADSQFIFSDEAPYASRTYAHLLKRMNEKYNAGIQSLLEIGSSTGFFLEEAQALGIHDVLGFEPSTDCYEHTSESTRKLMVNDVYNPELAGNRTFDLACGFHVFDHLRDPRQVLESMLASVNPGGYVLIACHDVESWSAKLLGSRSPIFDVEHIYLFSKKTLSALLESTDCTVLEADTLTNTYPLGYWMRMLPVADKLTGIMPKFFRDIPVRMKPGNLYAIAQKG